MTNEYIIELPSFNITLDEQEDNQYTLKDIIMNETQHKLSKKEILAEESAIVMQELIQSRVASEHLTAELTNENEQLKDENDYLLSKVNSLESMVDELNEAKLPKQEGE